MPRGEMNILLVVDWQSRGEIAKIMHADFDLPSRGRVDGRTSSITAAFFQAITPVIPPSDEEVEEALSVLGMALPLGWYLVS